MRANVVIAADRCKGCCLCIAVCQSGVLEMSPEPNRQGYAVPLVKQPVECIDCGMCEMICPEFAIWVRREESVIPDA